MYLTSWLRYFNCILSTNYNNNYIERLIRFVKCMPHRPMFFCGNSSIIQSNWEIIIYHISLVLHSLEISLSCNRRRLQDFQYVNVTGYVWSVKTISRVLSPRSADLCRVSPAFFKRRICAPRISLASLRFKKPCVSWDWLSEKNVTFHKSSRNLKKWLRAERLNIVLNIDIFYWISY